MGQKNEINVSLQRGKILLEEDPVAVMHGKEIDWFFDSDVPEKTLEVEISFLNGAAYFAPSSPRRKESFKPGVKIRGKAPLNPQGSTSPWARKDKYTITYFLAGGEKVSIDPDIRTNGP